MQVTHEFKIHSLEITYTDGTQTIEDVVSVDWRNSDYVFIHHLTNDCWEVETDPYTGEPRLVFYRGLENQTAFNISEVSSITCNYADEYVAVVDVEVEWESRWFRDDAVTIPDQELDVDVWEKIEWQVNQGFFESDEDE